LTEGLVGVLAGRAFCLAGAALDGARNPAKIPGLSTLEV
jgi:hypothetical protein